MKTKEKQLKEVTTRSTLRLALLEKAFLYMVNDMVDLEKRIKKLETKTIKKGK